MRSAIGMANLQRLLERWRTRHDLRAFARLFDATAPELMRMASAGSRTSTTMGTTKTATIAALATNNAPREKPS